MDRIKKILSFCFTILVVLLPSALIRGQGLNIKSGATLVNKGNFVIKSNWINDGAFSDTSATVIFSGTTQSIGGTVQSAFNNLTISSGSSTSVISPGQTIDRVLLCNGALNAGGYITLKSTSKRTALIDGSGTGTVSGNLTMQRYLPSGFGYKYFSSPFQNSTVSEFDDDRIIDPWFATVYSYDENNIISGLPASGWVEYETSSNTLNPLSGYAVNFGDQSAARTVDVTGVVNNGSMSVTLYNHNQIYTQGFNLVGNPYPSPIDWSAPSGWTKTNIDNALYFFKASTSDPYGGRYSTWVNGISSDDTVSNIIPSMQGFFIHVTAGPPWPAAATLALDNNTRITGLSQIFAKSGDRIAESLLRLTATLDGNMPSSDHMVIYFDEKADKDFNSELDALKLMNTDYYAPSIYSFSSDKRKLSINSLPDEGDSLYSIPLGIKTSIDDYLIIKLATVGSYLSGWKIYITDLKSERVHDLRAGDGYRVFLGAGECNDRFILNLTPVATAIAETRADEIFSVYSSHGIVKSYIDIEKTGEGDLKIFNLSGQLLFVERIVENGYNEFQPKLKDGIYIATFKSEKYRNSRKLFFNNR